MKKCIAGGLIVFMAMIASFAGDSAVFVDNGFSSDGKYYAFGQYGKIDKKFQGWAEIYIVDVERNVYTSDGVFITKPSSSTYNKTGKEVYNALAARSKSVAGKYSFTPAKPDCILYIREDENKSGTDAISFKDFSGSVSDDQAHYTVKLISDVSGSGENIKSSFVIMLEKVDENDKTIAIQKIGSPHIVRPGVSAYKIEKIVCDSTGNNIVFIIEKTVEDKTGVNIRYMIESATLSDDFFN